MPERVGLPTWIIADVLSECIRESYEMNPRYVGYCLQSTAKTWRGRLTGLEWDDVWGRVRKDVTG